jgi:indolepyruvate ferredoxin oxidoreductase, alpha subunit
MPNPFLTSDSPGKKVLFMGNEALARGALEAGVQIAASYPGTPSSEILENIASVADRFHIHAEWSTNEKVAFEVGVGSAISGLRTLVSMKHVGVNWIADPLMSVNQTGVRGSLVIIVADDPSAYSSQNEQDSRFYSYFAEIPMLEPSNPQEAKDAVVAAFDLSEKLELPVFVRSMTRLSHSRGDVSLGGLRKERNEAKFIKDPKRWVMVATQAPNRHKWLHNQQERMKEETENLFLNHLDLPEKAKFGVIASGVAYTYASEALDILKLRDKVAMLKIGVVNPLPEKKLKRILSSVDKILVVEEVEPIFEEKIRALTYGLDKKVEIHGKLTGDLPREREYTPDLVLKALTKLMNIEYVSRPKILDEDILKAQSMILPRAISMCPGCPHRATFYCIKQALRKTGGKGIISGDIGCYNLGAFPPTNMQDTTYGMGGSIGVGCGLAQSHLKEHVIATIGDSTFLHAGIPALINATYNDAKFTVVILDNLATAMTGFQPHPGTGITATGEKTTRIDTETMVRACGVSNIAVTDPYNVAKTIDTIEKALRSNEAAVVISKRECALEAQREYRRKGVAIYPYKVIKDKCTGCRLCVTQFGCPAIVWDENGKADIDTLLCTGCSVCGQMCPVHAIVEAKQ